MHTYIHNKQYDTDQTARMRSMIWALVIHICNMQILSRQGPLKITMVLKMQQPSGHIISKYNNNNNNYNNDNNNNNNNNNKIYA